METTLGQLAAVPGVVGSMVFDAFGTVLASAFPPVFDPAGLSQLAGQLSADGYFQEWLSGEQAVLDLRFTDGHVVVRPLYGSWLLVLCTAQANGQLLTMSLTQVIRRLRAPAAASPAAMARPLSSPTPPVVPAVSVLDRLREIASAELGEHATQAMEILAAAGPMGKDLQRATSDIEKMTRLFISKAKAAEIGRKLREALTG